MTLQLLFHRRRRRALIPERLAFLIHFLPVHAPHSSRCQRDVNHEKNSLFPRTALFHFRRGVRRCEICGLKIALPRRNYHRQIMPSKKQTFGTFMIAALFAFAAQINTFAKDAKPIVDIRFDSPYMQITNSQGDEWAPTWADDGNLYSGNDDGYSFGGISSRSVAFGKLVGDDPFHLVGSTLNDMGDYGINSLNSDHANWKTMNSYCVDGILYMFVTRCLYPGLSGDPKNRHIFKNSSIIKSTDLSLIHIYEPTRQ